MHRVVLRDALPGLKRLVRCVKRLTGLLRHRDDNVGAEGHEEAQHEVERGVQSGLLHCIPCPRRHIQPPLHLQHSSRIILPLSLKHKDGYLVMTPQCPSPGSVKHVNHVAAQTIALWVLDCKDEHRFRCISGQPTPGWPREELSASTVSKPSNSHDSVDMQSMLASAPPVPASHGHHTSSPSCSASLGTALLSTPAEQQYWNHNVDRDSGLIPHAL